MEMQSLASCALERLGKKHGKIQKTDFPDRYMVRLRRETESVTLWDVDLIAVDQESTRVAIVIPPKVENVRPDQLFADLETCAVPPAGGARLRDDLQPSLFVRGGDYQLLFVLGSSALT
jgi:hypothetical protein